MAKYRVIKSFSDLQDNSYKYGVGDAYPRTGFIASEDRVRELSTTMNKRGVAFIAEIPVEVSPLPDEVYENAETDESTICILEPKEKPRKSRKNNAKANT